MRTAFIVIIEHPDAEQPQATCKCPRFTDTGGYRIADLTCPIHGVRGTDPGDGDWDDDAPALTDEQQRLIRLGEAVERMEPAVGATNPNHYGRGVVDGWNGCLLAIKERATK